MDLLISSYNKSCDARYLLFKLLDVMTVVDERSIEGMNEDQFLKHFKAKFPEFIEVSLNMGFIQDRKRYLEKIMKTKRIESLIDLLFLLKPSPSLDITLIDIDKKGIRSLKDQGIQALQITEYFANSTLSMKDRDLVCVIRYNDTWGKWNFNNTEYSGTIITEGCVKGISIPYQHLVYNGKSLSAGLFKKGGFGILAYKASTTENSSGGPILNSNGDIIGLAFGNYEDIEIKEEEPKEDLIIHDITLPGNDKSYYRTKNCNLGIAIDHEFLISYSQFFSNSHIQISQDFSRRKGREQDYFKKKTIRKKYCRIQCCSCPEEN